MPIFTFLHQLLSVVLGEHTVKTDVQTARRRFQVDHAIVDRVQPHPVRRKQPHQVALVAGIPKESIQPPHDHVRYPVGLHQLQQLLYPGPFQTGGREASRYALSLDRWQ